MSKITTERLVDLVIDAAIESAWAGAKTPDEMELCRRVLKEAREELMTRIEELETDSK